MKGTKNFDLLGLKEGKASITHKIEPMSLAKMGLTFVAASLIVTILKVAIMGFNKSN